MGPPDAIPPQAKKVPHQFEEIHGEVRVDEYYWLRDDERKHPDVLAYVEEENKYTEAVMADTKPLQETLFQEMRGRIQEKDTEVPVRHGPWWYYNRTEEGKQYTIHCRRATPDGEGPGSLTEVMPEGPDAPAEEVLLDENQRFELFPGDFYRMVGYEVSPDHRLLAIGEDIEGAEKYTLRILDLATGEETGRSVPDTGGQFAWANDNKTLFYVVKDKLDRPYQVWRHNVAGGEEADVLVYHETDESFYLYLYKSLSEDWLLLSSSSQVTSHSLGLPADQPLGEWVEITPRVQGVDTDVSHLGRHFFITRRSDELFNSELLICSTDNPTTTTCLLPHRPSVKLETIKPFQNHLVVHERENGLQAICVYCLPAAADAPILELGQPQKVSFEEETYALSRYASQFKSHIMRFWFSSLKTPDSVFDYDMNTGDRALRKVKPVPGYRAEEYECVRRWATAPDGVRVPVSVLYRRGLAKLDGTDPLLLDGYGAYEICNSDNFRSNLFSLVDRGFVYAQTHIRGGGEMGRMWYEDGKYLKKKNTFEDFIACAEYLVKEKFAAPDKVTISGRSAGGLLIGAVLNMRPDLFAAALAGVPFVDVLTTMLDTSIPLTTIEWEEWGNPQNKEYYEYIKSYSPIDNVAATAYPNILVTAGLNDPRVGYWEPAKWVARLRELKTDDKLLLLKVDMGAGHFSKSGRFDRLKEVAFEYAFLLKALGMMATPTAP